MALFKILKGQKSNLDKQTINEGWAYVTSDEHKMYVDTSASTRIALNADLADRISYGTCDKAAGTAEKVVSLSNETVFNLTAGKMIAVYFENTNTVANPTLSINGTAKAIKKYGTNTPGTTVYSSWPAGAIVTFIYDGSFWRMISVGDRFSEVAASANKTLNSLIIKSDGGTTEGKDLYTFDGSTAKTLNLISGTNVTLTEDTGSITFSSPSLSGGSSNVADATVVSGITVNGHNVGVSKKTMTAGTGISISGTATAVTVGHSNSITAGSVGTAATASWGNTFAIPKLTYDAQGHITEATTVNITMPANPNTDYKVLQTVMATPSSFTDYYSLMWSADSHASSTSSWTLANKTGSVYIDKDLYVQPSTGTIFATKFNGALIGNADTATGFASNKTISLSGDISGSADGGANSGWSITTTIGSGKVTNDMLTGSIANAKLANSSITLAGRSVSLGGSITKANMLADLGLSSAMHFLGITTTPMSDGLATAAVTINSESVTPFSGDVVLDDDTHYEYVWSGTYWELLGGDSSYKITQEAVDSGNASTNKWISRVQQDTNGNLTLSTGTLDTSGTWSGNAGSASRLNITSTDNAIARFDGTNGVVQDSNVYLGDDASLNIDNKFKTWLYTFDYDNSIPLRSLALQSQENYFSIVEIQAPTDNPKEATLCLKTEGTVSGGRTVESFADISFTQYNSTQPTFALIGQKRGTDVYPKFVIGFSDGTAWDAFAINPKNTYNGQPDKRAWFADDIYIGGSSGSEIDVYSHKVVKEGRTPYSSSDSTTVIGNYSVAIGENNRASGTYSVALGDSNIVGGELSFGVGYENTINGEASSALGSDNSVLGDYSFAIGTGNNISTSIEIGMALGSSNTVSATGGVAIGGENTASGEYGIAIGYNNTASGEISIALGASNSVSAYASMALGQQNVNTGSSALLIGAENTSSGWASILGGSENSSTEDLSFLFGTNNTGSAESAVALGNYNTISGYGASAIGQHLVASKYAETVVGAYNVANPSTDYVFAVGIGYDDDGTEHRADGFVVDWDGNGIFTGNTTAVNGIYSGTLNVSDTATMRNIYPATSATYALGSSSLKWKEAYIQSVHTDNTVTAVTGISVGSLPNWSYSYDSSTETMTISWSAGSLPSISSTGSAVQAM